MWSTNQKTGSAGCSSLHAKACLAKMLNPFIRV